MLRDPPVYINNRVQHDPAQLRLADPQDISCATAAKFKPFSTNDNATNADPSIPPTSASTPTSVPPAPTSSSTESPHVSAGLADSVRPVLNFALAIGLPVALAVAVWLVLRRRRRQHLKQIPHSAISELPHRGIALGRETLYHNVRVGLSASAMSEATAPPAELSGKSQAIRIEGQHWAVEVDSNGRKDKRQGL